MRPAVAEDRRGTALLGAVLAQEAAKRDLRLGEADLCCRSQEAFRLVCAEQTVRTRHGHVSLIPVQHRNREHRAGGPVTELPPNALEPTVRREPTLRESGVHSKRPLGCTSKPV